MTTMKTMAHYRPGRKPVFLDLERGPNVGLVKLTNGSLISVDQLVDLRDRVLAVSPHVATDDELKTEHFYLADEWDVMDNCRRRLMGMVLAYLVTTKAVDLDCLNPNKSGTKKYRRKA